MPAAHSATPPKSDTNRAPLPLATSSAHSAAMADVAAMKPKGKRYHSGQGASSASEPASGKRAKPSASKKVPLEPVTLEDSGGQRVTIDPALNYLHILARDPLMPPVQGENGFRKDLLSYRQFPSIEEARLQLLTGRARRRGKRQRDEGSTSSTSSTSNGTVSQSQPQTQPLKQAPIPIPTPNELLLLPSPPPALPSHLFASPLDALVKAPPLPRRKKAVDRCTSPSHFVESRLSLTLHGTDDQLDTPVRSRMDDLLFVTSSAFFPPRLIANDDSMKVWSDVDAGRRWYTSIDRITCPIRRRRPIEHWSLKELALFETGICQYGKDFHAIQKLIGTKSTSECVEFYYSQWKGSLHYCQWKGRVSPKGALASASVTVKLEERASSDNTLTAVVANTGHGISPTKLNNSTTTTTTARTKDASKPAAPRKKASNSPSLSLQSVVAGSSSPPYRLSPSQPTVTSVGVQSTPMLSLSSIQASLNRASMAPSPPTGLFGNSNLKPQHTPNQSVPAPRQSGNQLAVFSLASIANNNVSVGLSLSKSPLTQPTLRI